MSDTSGIRKQKILIVIGTYKHMGGAERQALHLMEHLQTLQNCDVEMLSFEDGALLRSYIENAGVRAHSLPYFHKWPARKRTLALFRIGRYVRTRIDPVAILPFVGIHSKASLQFQPLTRAKFCWWNQQDEGRDLSGSDREGRILRKAGRVISNSYAGQDFICATYGVSRDLVEVYNNGTILPPTAAPETAGPTGSRKSVAMIANIIPFKDHHTLLKAWAVVKGRFQDAGEPLPVLKLAGHMRNAQWAAGLKGAAFELGLSSQDVEFLGPVEDVNRLVTESSLVVHSSLTEGCPNAVCEAMALARPVVATDIPGCRQALGEHGARWLAAPKDPEDLARKIITMLESDALRQETGEANRQRIERDFSIPGMNRYFQSVIERGIGAGLS